MAVTIRTISNASKKDLRKFIVFNYKLYRHSKYAVPEMFDDLMSVFMPSRNAAYDFCEAQFFMAYKGKKPVGRIVGIINHRANETWNKQSVRFGWIDFVDDEEVSRALIDAVIQWGRERGMKEIEGPLGFTDFDREGMLIEGFDQLGTMAAHYNYDYYPRHMEKLGFTKGADWVEYKIFPPKEVPEKFQRVCDIVQSRYHLHVRKYTSRKKLRVELGQEIFHVINEAYMPLYGFSRLSERQIDQYIKAYLGIVDLRLIPLVFDENETLVGVGIMMPSLSRALRRGRGARRFWGYLPLAWTLFVRRPKNTDLLLVAVKPEYQGKGVNALIIADLIPTYKRLGYRYAESNPELETNAKVQSQWDYFDHVQHKRRCCWVKEI